MKKIIILIPVFNDWDSLKKLLLEISKNIDDLKEVVFKCIIINDASTTDYSEINKPKNFESLKILNMKINKGHAQCNAFGIKYIFENEKFDNILLMDGDGEDRPEELRDLVNQVLKYPNFSVVAKRTKRSENFIFKFLYRIHKLITLIFTGKIINFGYFSCLAKKDAEKIVLSPSLKSSYSGTFKKNIKKYNTIKSIRGIRYFGPSKMPLTKLLIHSFSIITVFKYRVFLSSFLYLLILYLMNLNSSIVAIFQILIIIFCFIIFLTSLRSKKEELYNSHENLKNIKYIIH